MFEHSGDTLRPETTQDDEAAFPKEYMPPKWSINLPTTILAIKAGRTIIYWWLCGATTIALLYAFFAAPYYMSTATFIAQSPSNASSLLTSQLSAIGASGLGSGLSKSNGELYVGILKSIFIRDKMISRFDLMHVYRAKRLSLAEKALASHSTFDFDPRDSIVTIQVTDYSPDRAQKMAHGYLDELRSANQQLALTESSQRRVFYGQQLAAEKNALADSEVELKKTQERTGLIAPAGQTSLQLQSIAQVRTQIASHEVELSSLRQSLTDNSPQIGLLQAQISDLNRQLGSLQDGKSSGKMSNISASEVPELGLEYIRKARDVKYHEALFEVLLKQFEAARMEEAQDPQLLQILDQGTWPDIKAGPSKMLIILGGIFVGLIGGLFSVLLRAARIRSGEA